MESVKLNTQMIPYINVSSVQIGPFSAHPFGVLVVMGVLLGSWFARKRAREFKIPDNEMVVYIYLALGGGFIGAHLIELFFYRQNWYEQTGIWGLLNIWEGWSSMGGFLGAVVTVTIYYFMTGRKSWWRHAELMYQGLILGLIFGRLGCAVTHDHPGAFTNFFLGVKYPDGVRHDLGFYEFLLLLVVLMPLSLVIQYKKLRLGSQIAYLSLIYAPVRFFFDFLRVDGPTGDQRYFSLTAAQYLCILLFCFATWVAMRLWKHEELEPTVRRRAVAR